MPKIIELTVEIDVHRVSCPGVWLCQDGRVSLTVFALGTSYQTCLLPPMFPLMFKDIFYFRKRFEETCALNNICCLLKEETIYCELVQWCEDCSSGECTILAQYLGSLNDVLFPPNMCSNEGVDLLMRRSKDFPGILSPKIEIATKVRIDEVWNQYNNIGHMKGPSCDCTRADSEVARQKQVCHTPMYHRYKCNTSRQAPAPGGPRSRSRSLSCGSRSWCTLPRVDIPDPRCTNRCTNPPRRYCPRRRPRSASRARPCAYAKECDNERRYVSSLCDDERSPPCRRSNYSPARCPRSVTRVRPCQQYNVYNVETGNAWARHFEQGNEKFEEEMMKESSSDSAKLHSPTEVQKILLESRYIEEEINERKRQQYKFTTKFKPKINPCVCEICRKYHLLFHSDHDNS